VHNTIKQQHRCSI